MFCEQCGKEINDDAVYCPKCGTIVTTPSDSQTGRKNTSRENVFSGSSVPVNGEHGSSNMVLYPDGKYRWIYEMSLFKNPTIFLLILKVFLIVFAIVFAFVFLVQVIDSGFDPDALLGILKVMGFVALGIVVLVTISYLIYAAIMKGKYIVEFTMDEKGILHSQIDEQAKKARGIGNATLLTGVLTGSMSSVGLGLNSQRTSMYSEFSSVKNIKSYQKRNLIKLNSFLNKNQVYVAAEDFDFVEEYISSRCTNAKFSRHPL